MLELLKKRWSWSGFALLIVVVALVWSMFNIKLWKVGRSYLENTHGIAGYSEEVNGGPRSVINNDITNYYSYLPAAFIHQDLSFKFVYESHKNLEAHKMFWPVRVEGKEDAYVIKMTMGMAFLYSPFFLIAHFYTVNFTDYPPDGFSPPYEAWLVVSSIFYLIIGFYFLRKLLLVFFKDWIAAVVMLMTMFGTNLYYYASSEPAMSHAYSFSLISIFAYVSYRWIKKPLVKWTIVAGITGGLIVLIRPVNILVFIFPLLVSITSTEDLKNRIMHFVQNYKLILLAAFCAFIVVFPQLLFWKVNAGSWLYYSYSDEHFFFTNPHIIDGLFSYRKGWLLYTPIMIFPIIGIVISYFKRRELFWPLAVYLPIHIYVVYSWWCWWYGGSFGSRPMIEAYALLSLPLGVLITWVAKNRFMLVSFSIASLLLISLNLFQTARYRYGSIHYHGMNKEAYWMNFWHRDPVPGYWESVKDPDYGKAIKGEEEYEVDS